MFLGTETDRTGSPGRRHDGFVIEIPPTCGDVSKFARTKSRDDDTVMLHSVDAAIMLWRICENRPRRVLLSVGRALPASTVNGENVQVKVIIGVSIGLTILTAGCNLRTVPYGSTTGASGRVVAASPAPAIVSPAANPSPLMAISPTPVTVTPVPAAAVDSKATTTTGDEAAAAPPKPNPLPTLGPGGNKDYAAVTGANSRRSARPRRSTARPPRVRSYSPENCPALPWGLSKARPGWLIRNSDDGTVPCQIPLILASPLSQRATRRSSPVGLIFSSNTVHVLRGPIRPSPCPLGRPEASLPSSRSPTLKRM